MGYFARERIFTGFGPNQSSSVPVFAVEDFNEDECKALAASVQQCLDKLHEFSGSGPWYFELGPSAEENAAEFINLKSDWNSHKSDLVEYRKASSNSWMSEIAWLHDIAQEHADIIREMRWGHTPTIYLQCDGGRGYDTFARIDFLTELEIETLEEVLHPQLNELGYRMRIVGDWHAEKEPSVFVQARLSWKRFEEECEDGSVSDDLRTAGNIAFECCDEITELRRKPLKYAADEFEVDEEDSITADAPHESVEPSNGSGLIVADESLRSSYRDPDNYWRNVWLYRQRQSRKTNAAILAELSARASEFAPLESANALRSAIDSIAHHHKWPVLKGRPGRPRVKPSVESDVDSLEVLGNDKQRANQQLAD